MLVAELSLPLQSSSVSSLSAAETSEEAEPGGAVGRRSGSASDSRRFPSALVVLQVDELRQSGRKKCK